MNDPAIEHSSGLLDPGTVKNIRSRSSEAEQLKTLHPDQLSLIYERKWFNMFVPKEFGGLGLTLPEGLRLEEALAWADGSLGWTVTLCSGANWFIGFLDPAVREKLFVDKKVCLAGSGYPSGTAVNMGEDFDITGRWKYASGATHATAFTANCQLVNNGELLVDETGAPLIKSFLFLKNEVRLYDDWQTVGMIATASESFSVQSLKLNSSRSFEINPARAILSNPIYQYPFLPFAETTLSVNSSGMAARFIELADLICSEKQVESGINSKIFLSEKMGEAKNRLLKLRVSFYSAVENSWQQCEKNRTLSQESLAELSTESRNLATGSRAIVDELYPFCGMLAANPSQEINRVWRNLHTASQHNLLLYPAV